MVALRRQPAARTNASLTVISNRAGEYSMATVNPRTWL